jgi:hypothetical protein
MTAATVAAAAILLRLRCKGVRAMAAMRLHTTRMRRRRYISAITQMAARVDQACQQRSAQSSHTHACVNIQAARVPHLAARIFTDRQQRSEQQIHTHTRINEKAPQATHLAECVHTNRQQRSAQQGHTRARINEKAPRVTHLAARVLPNCQHAVLRRVHNLQVVRLRARHDCRLDLIVVDAPEAAVTSVALPVLIAHTPTAIGQHISSSSSEDKLYNKRNAMLRAVCKRNPAQQTAFCALLRS